MNYLQKSFLSIFLGTLLGGATATITKIGIMEFPPLSFAFIRFFIASILILPFFLKLKKHKLKEFKDLVPVSLFASINIILFIIGIKTTTATIGQLLYAGVPLLTGLIAYWFLDENFNLKKIVGIIIGFIGVGLVVFLPVIEKGQVFAGDLKGNLLIAVAVIFFSTYMVFSKNAQKRYSPFVVTAIFIFVTTILLFPFFVYDQSIHTGWWHALTIKGVIAMLYITIVATIITYILNQYAIKHGGSIFASMAYYLLPVFSFFSAFLLLGERLTQGILIGGILALLGVFFVTKK